MHYLILFLFEMLGKDNQKMDNYSEIPHLKEEIKSKEGNIKTILRKEKDKNEDKDDISLKIFGNNINERKPKYYGKTKSLLFLNENPILILGEDSNSLLFNI